MYFYTNSFISYRNYLRSSWWKHRRARKLLKEKHTCERCGDKATVVHHKEYSRLWSEPDEHLEALCKGCHYIHHKAEIESRERLKRSKGSEIS